MLSIVIPTLNAGSSLPATLASLEERPTDSEIVVSDGFSTDATRAVAQAAGLRVVESPRGRGMQLAAGAAAARGDWLLFLHADTRLAPGWAAVVRCFCAVGSQRAAYFRFTLDDDAAAARRLEALVAWRCRRLGLPYGDQGLLIATNLYRETGGFHALPLMEDVHLVRRLGRHRLVGLDHPAITSAARYQDGYLRRSLRNLSCLALYFAGLPPARIVRLYE
ncbi:MAG: glycosyltransferase [Alphaproteobacteria bacterium]|nr:glycosyltransferase [Alphaproteobacteria bacterium]